MARDVDRPGHSAGRRVVLEASLRVRLRLGGSAVVVMERLHLLELVGREDRRKPLFGVFADGSHLLFPDHGSHRGIVSQRGDLLVAIGENGFELRGLIGREVELLAESCDFTLGVVSMVVGRDGGGGRFGRLLCQGETGRECQGQGGGEENSLHGCCSF